MHIQVSDQIIASAVKCTKGNSCLSDTPTEICKVIFSINCKLLGILCTEDDYCAYKHTMEDRTCCTCPVRAEIYAKYNI